MERNSFDLQDFTKLEDDDDALLTDHAVPDHQINGATSNANLIVPELNAHQNSTRVNQLKCFKILCADRGYNSKHNIDYYYYYY